LSNRGSGRQQGRTVQERDGPGLTSARARIGLFWLLGLLIALRLLYHAAYWLRDPFAHATFSDGQIYEEAARDILAHPPLGSQPFFLQGAYAYLIAAGLALRGMPSDALLLQLGLCALGAWGFHRAARSCFGANAALLSSAALLASGALAFYENKYLSAALGCSCNCLVLWAFARLLALERPGRADYVRAAGVGLSSALCLLARPNMLLALPFTAGALLWWARARGRRALPLMAAGILGLALGIAPLSARNWLVTGSAGVFPSHGGGIPFYIGNNPASTGLWNTAGGLLSGQVLLERRELAAQLGLDPQDPALDDRIGRALYARAFAFMREQPAAWLAIEARKLYFMLGNAEVVHDYDWLGERELLDPVRPVELPFGLLLGLGVLGLLQLARGSPELRALNLLLLGQLLAVAAANLLWFSSAQNRLPLVIPLAFACGPAVLSSLERPREAGWLPLALCALLCAQAFYPRSRASQPSAAHYYNLANVEESLGQNAAALAHYIRATERNPRQPVFWARLARLAEQSERPDLAASARRRLQELQGMRSGLAP
jgi:tetratricopeptide (TPR) repeat protein